MVFKNLLVHVDDSKAIAKRLAAAIALAQAHGAHLIGIYPAIEPYLPGNIATGVPAQLLSVLEEQAAEPVQSSIGVAVTPLCRGVRGEPTVLKRYLCRWGCVALICIKAKV